MGLSEKKDRIQTVIAEKGSILVAYSGGVDSALLAYLSRLELKEKSRCALLDSPFLSRDGVRQAVTIAGECDLSLEILPAPYLASGVLKKNPADRCYHCKKISCRILRKRAKELGLSSVADGLNVSDTKEYRPGTRACEEEGISHPFIEAGITKEDIRAIARGLGLSFWDKPSDACLSTRIPYGEEITEELLARIEHAEKFLHGLGIRQLRVRVHGTLARIETDNEGMTTVFTNKGEVVKRFRKIGFLTATLDLAGYRSGSMDEIPLP
jgi:uncharacterized protein